jgi:hypothetical protein
MKKVSNWFEVILENAHNSRDWFTGFILVLVVLFVGAGSLYMLLNTQG